jgi:crossover junction endodeoxyribonuclease RuvC
MRILGIDPGSDTTGYGLIESVGSRHSSILFGAIRTSPRLPFHERLLQIYTQLMEILSRETIDAVAVENVFHAANARSALRLGHARGVALLVAAQQKLPVFEYSPLEIKSVGYGRAEKSQVQMMVQLLLNLEQTPAPADAADALAVAICHSHRTSREILLPPKSSRRRR